MTAAVDVVIVGSGPAGVSAAWPLVEAGLRVVMLDAGNRTAREGSDDRTFLDIRRSDGDQWRRFLGSGFQALKGRGDVSPKLRVPASDFVFQGFADAYRLEARNFVAVGSLARGGLSNVWGAGAYAYDDTDLDGFPIDRRDLEESFRRVAARIGLSGVAGDDLGAFYGAGLPLQPPLPVDDNAARLLDRYEERRPLAARLGIRLGRARNAVLSQPLGGRSACDLSDMCLWGCGKGAIYNAADEVRPLSGLAGFEYRGGAFVGAIRREGDAFRVDYGPPGAGATAGSLLARTVVLAAGTIGSTRLALDFLGWGNGNGAVPLLSNVAFALAFVLPERLGAALPERGFALGQLGYVVEDADDRRLYAHGAVFAPTGMLGSEFVRHMPFTRPGAARIARRLQPALLAANSFLPGEFSRNTLRLEGAGPGARVVIDGAHADGVARRIQGVRRRLVRLFRRLGAFALPGGGQAIPPGADIHYAGTLPMTAAGQAARGPGTDAFGELAGAPGLYVVDGAVLSRLPAKNPTFTIMANADRIGHRIAARQPG